MPDSHQNDNPQFHDWWIDWLINPLHCILVIEDHTTLNRNLEAGYNTLLLQLIQGDLYGACPHRQFDTLCGLLHSQTALPDSYPKAGVPSREAVCTIFMMVCGLMTQPRWKPMTYCMRSGHINHPDVVPAQFQSIITFIFSHPPKRRRVTYASGFRPVLASTLCTSSLKPLHGIISY